MTALNQWDKPVAAEASAPIDWTVPAPKAAPTVAQRTMVFARAASRGAVKGLSLGWLTVYVIVAGLAVQGLLIYRVWAQLMGEAGLGGIRGAAYDASSFLVSPFHSFEPTTPVKDSGILEFASLVAIEAYLIVTLIGLTVLFSARLALAAERSIVRHRRRRRSPSVRPIVLESDV